MRPVEQCGLPRLVTEKAKATGVRDGAGAAADAKVTSGVGGMAAGADSVDAPHDLDFLRHGAMPTPFGGIRAPAALSTFLRAFSYGHVHPTPRRGQEVPVNDIGVARRVTLPVEERIARVGIPVEETAAAGTSVPRSRERTAASRVSSPTACRTKNGLAKDLGTSQRAHRFR